MNTDNNPQSSNNNQEVAVTSGEKGKVLPDGHTTPPSSIPTTARSLQIKSLLVKMMLGCLIAAASVAVIAILAGSMGDVAWRAIWTIISAVIHIGLLFAVISMTSSDNPRLQRSTNFVVNTSIVITILSFFTSILGTWEVFTGSLPWKLYATYAVALFLVLHAKTLMDVEAVYGKVKNYVLANYGFMILVGMLILGVVYTENGSQLLDGFYGRLLAASAIVDVTLSMIVAVMHRLHIQKHPELQSQQQAKGGASAVKIVVTILLFIFVVWPVVGMVMAFGSTAGH